MMTDAGREGWRGCYECGAFRVMREIGHAPSTPADDARRDLRRDGVVVAFGLSLSDAEELVEGMRLAGVAQRFVRETQTAIIDAAYRLHTSLGALYRHPLDPQPREEGKV